jgi:uncharacterized membrane protein
MKKYWSILKSPQSLSIQQWLMISCEFSMVLLFIRILGTGYLSYGFLAWNLFLGYVPYFISGWLTQHKEVFQSRIKLLGVLLCWLLFIPNSFYILTDLFHLYKMGNGHSWFDLTLIMSFAWNGILLGVLSMQQMEKLLKSTKGRYVSGIVIAAVMWLNAVGVYIGRYMRYNSWDVITNPFALCSEVFEMMINPYDYRYVWAMTVCFGAFMVIIYYTIKKTGDSA